VILPDGLGVYAQLCGWTLARAHARSGDRIAIGSYIGASDVFAQALAGFATAYADQNEKDHEALVKAIADGSVPADAAALASAS
jgi:predicted alpha/beta hydrolase